VRKFKVYILSSLLSFILFLDCNKSLDVVENNDNSNNANKKYYSISGQIRDSLTNSQLDSVYVLIPGDTTFLSRYGSFEIKNRTENTYKIYFNKINYYTKLFRLNLNSDTSVVIQLSVKPVPIDSDTVDYYPLMIGNTWKYHRLYGDILGAFEGTEDWTVTDTNLLENGIIEYSIHTVSNGKYVEEGTTDTIDIINDVHNLIITETQDHLLYSPHFNSQFNRYYNEAELDTVKIIYNDGQNELIYKLYLVRDVGMVYAYYQFFPINNRSMYPYSIYTLIE
jgi:hypothetical protein